MIYCLYHETDLDGHCSGELVRNFYIGAVKMVPANYGMILPDNISNKDIVYVVDFSVTREQMYYLQKIGAQVIWIDHHESAIKKLDDFKHIDGIRRIGSAGCELVWEYLHGDKQMPDFVRLLGRYDVWDHSDDKVVPFQFGMHLIGDTSPGCRVWYNLFDFDESYSNKIINNGKTVIMYESSRSKKYAKTYAFTSEILGNKCVAMNHGCGSSKLFDSVYDSLIHDFMVAFAFDGEMWNYSIYSEKDCCNSAEIAVRYGGGGHKGAAGFRINENIFEVKK